MENLKKGPINNQNIDEKLSEYIIGNNIKGLTSQDVQKRIELGEVNKVVNTSFKSLKEIIFENVFTYFNFIFLILSLLLFMVQSYKNLTFLPIIIANILIGIFQEIKSKKILDKLNVLNTPNTNVVRNETIEQIDVNNLVLDDTIVLQSGDQIPADAIVISGEVLVNESLLTGESNEIKKEAGSELMSGSYITSGTCFAKLIRVGVNSYISKLTIEAKSIKNKEQSVMIRSLNKLVKWIGIIIIPIGATLFIQGYVLGDLSLKDSIISMEAALIGMIPEGLYLLTTLALTLSVVRLAKEKVLIHNMKSIETLARVDVLCVDKTGTITENKMKVSKLIDVNTNEELSEDSLIYQLISDFCYNMPNENNTMSALKDYFHNSKSRTAKHLNTFSSRYKFSSVTFEEDTYVLGAPEMIVPSTFHLYEKSITQYTSQGYRLLLFGKYSGKLDEPKLIHDVEPMGYVILTNSIRKEAKETFAYFDKQDVKIKVISGDNPQTVSEVAIQAGIKNADRYVDATKLSSDNEIINALNQNVVFGRVTPEHKKRFVELLQNEGRTVAMTGDGVNDILALKAADCSIAMASGSKATTQASQVVLLESDFSKMPYVVAEGRQVANNIERSGSLFLVKNIFSLFVSIFAIIFAIAYPLEPSQVSLIGLLTIGVPSFFLALEPNNNQIRGSFIKNIIRKALPGGLTDIVMLIIIMLIGIFFQPPKKELSTVATILLAYVGFLILIKISLPLNDYRKKIIFLCLILFLLLSLMFHKLFALTSLSILSMILLIGSILIGTTVFIFINKVFKYLNL